MTKRITYRGISSVARFAALASFVAAAGCGGGDSTAPVQAAPTLTVVNGVPHPTGLVGMSVAIQGTSFATAANGKVFFTPTGGAPIQATIANAATDWTDALIVTTVPVGVTGDAKITVQTAAGTSNAVPFTLVSSAAFSPSTIAWAPTTALPTALQGIGAAFVPVTTGAHASYVFGVGGADATNTAGTTVYRSPVQPNGALGAWTTTSALPSARAYHTVVAATAYSAPLDTTTTAAYLYAIGGVDATGQTVSTVYVEKVAPDGTVGGWQATTALPVALHSAAAAVFGGYVYLVGGATGTNAPVATTYRAAVNGDGTLGAWQSLAPLPVATAYLSLAQFGPYLYAAGGDVGTVAPVLNTSSATETGAVYVASINPRDGTLTSAGWTTLTAMTKGRSKHSLLAAGGALLTSSGVYSGAAGSSENAYATLNPDGSVGSWNGATGTNTIASVVGYSLYNQAGLSFADATGIGHVVILGGADRATPGKASAAVVYY